MLKRYITTSAWIVLLVLAVGCKSTSPPIPLPTAYPEYATSIPGPTPTFQLPSMGTSSPESTPPATREAPAEIVVGPPGTAANCADRASAFDIERAMEHIEILTGDEMNGRRAGSPGGRAAGDYIAALFAEYGLQPAGQDGDYFQSVPVSFRWIADPAELTIISHGQQALPHTYIYGTDYMPITRWYADAGESVGQAVWLSECRRSDYDWQDVVGKIVLCRSDVRNVEVYRQAIAHRAGGVLMVDLEDEGHPFQRSVYRQPPLVAETIPAFRISRSVAEDLLAGSGYTLENLSLRFQAVPLSTTVRISIDVEEEEIEARNVLGLLPGSDLEVGAKVIVIGAHYDHVGSDLGEAIIRGANDNASGTAVLLEIALLWQEQGRRPARSVLFAAWRAEDIDSSGVAHYLEHPAIPITQTVGVIALDSVGAGKGSRLLYTAPEREIPLAWPIETGASQLGRRVRYMDDEDGWQTLFGAAGIPTVRFTWERAEDDAYLPSDTVDAINVDKLASSGEVLILTASWLAGR